MLKWIFMSWEMMVEQVVVLHQVCDIWVETILQVFGDDAMGIVQININFTKWSMTLVPVGWNDKLKWWGQ